MELGQMYFEHKFSSMSLIQYNIKTQVWNQDNTRMEPGQQHKYGNRTDTPRQTQVWNQDRHRYGTGQTQVWNQDGHKYGTRTDTHDGTGKETKVQH